MSAAGDRNLARMVTATVTAIVFVALDEEQQDQSPGGEANPRLRQPRRFLCRHTLDAMSDEEIRVQFRLRRASILNLYEVIQADIQPQTGRSRAVPGMVRLLGALYILGRGTFQATSGSICGYSQPTVCRHFMRVIRAITARATQFICFPNNSAGWLAIKAGFHQLGGFPNVIGAVDCTHVALRAPRETEVNFRNRKQYHSLNALLVCDANQQIRAARTDFPGSCHDAYIFRHTLLCRMFETGDLSEGWLVGDAGFPQLPYLMTPVRYPHDAGQRNYNKALQSTRFVVERTIGLLKGRFLALARPGGELLYSPPKVAEIILACMVLHNLCLAHQDWWAMEEDQDMEPEVWRPPVSRREGTEQGRVTRDRVINDYFRP